MKNDTFKTVYPNKVFDYMCCAKPIIVGIDGVARELVSDANAGIFTEPEDAGEFVAAVLKLKNDPVLAHEMGNSGRKFVLEHFIREKLAARYLKIVTNVAAGTSMELSRSTC